MAKIRENKDGVRKMYLSNTPACIESVGAHEGWLVRHGGASLLAARHLESCQLMIITLENSIIIIIVITWAAPPGPV